MESFVEKFNLFDLFTMLIPGIINLTLFGVTLSFGFYNTWEGWGSEKYVVFFIISYFVGIIFQDLGTLLDYKFLYKILYGGKPKEIFLIPNNKVIENELFYRDAVSVKKKLVRHLNINTKNIKQKSLNTFIFEYCLSLCEIHNLASKAEKMFTISEMSRSLFWGNIFTIILNLVLIFGYSKQIMFLYIEIPFLLVSSVILLSRKKRYEKYRYIIIIRMVLLYIIQNGQDLIEHKIKENNK